jgi:hypothetical protein
MKSCWNDTLNGWSDQIVKINKTANENPDQEIYLSLCVFDDKIEFPGGIVKMLEGSSLPSIENITPRGSTALFDAIGESIKKLDFVVTNEIVNNEASVIMVILTDGYENASKNFSSDEIKKEMDKLRETGLWNFVFIGADFDITSTAGYFNADERNRRNVSKDNMNAAYQDVQKSFDNYIALKKKGRVNRNFFS